MTSYADAACDLYSKHKKLDHYFDDPVSKRLADADVCPNNVLEFKTLLQKTGFRTHAFMVANEGRYHSDSGSFSFFESVSGNGLKEGLFFFGHFTDAVNNVIVLDQRSSINKLLIELIAWDPIKQVFNFYELRGLDGRLTRWYYRGDSIDAFRDNRYLFRLVPDGKTKFGSRMRCSACHNQGGPILKELVAPHNDWWQKNRVLHFSPNQLSPDVSVMVQKLDDVSLFANHITKGMRKLSKSKAMKSFKNKLSLQELFRPLFCQTEMNLESGHVGVNDEKEMIHIPSSFWIHPLLGKINVEITMKNYKKVLETYDMHFADTIFQDADHAWLTPVPSHVDVVAIKQLIKENVLSREFVKSVLLIDYINPIFSSKRCDLLTLLPVNKNNWKVKFMQTLKDSEGIYAKQLYQYLMASGHNSSFIKEKIRIYKAKVLHHADSIKWINGQFKRLLARRNKVRESELSRNPLGQILEPGFRYIFPESGMET